MIELWRDRFDLPPKDFFARARLHLPQIHAKGAPADEERSKINELLHDLAKEDRNILDHLPARLRPDLHSEKSGTDLQPVSLCQEDAEIVFGKLHYIRSNRKHAKHFGLVSGSAHLNLVAAASLSQFDLRHLADSIPLGISRNEIAVLSRVYSYPSAPPNTLSRLISYVARQAYQDGNQLLLTYVNPNLGFTGASYRASNWIYFGQEFGTRYQYLDRRYVTDRSLADLFGTDDPTILAQRLGGRHRVAKDGLDALLLFARFSPSLNRQALESSFGFRFQRP